jgi:hypothetical protein
MIIEFAIPKIGKGSTLMKLDNPVRLGGLAAVLSGVLLVISQLLSLYLLILYPIIYGRDFFLLPWLGIDHYSGVLLTVLLQFALIGLYASQAKTAGVLGLVGFLVIFIGMLSDVGGSFLGPFNRPFLLSLSEVECEEFCGSLAAFGLTFVLGWVLFGVATLRASVYPRSTAQLLIAGALVALLPLPLSGVIFAVALAWMGYTLFTGETQEAAALRPRMSPNQRGTDT